MPEVNVRQYVAGEWVAGDGGPLERRNPAAPAEVVARGTVGTADDVDRAVASARAGQSEWAARTSHARGAVLRAAAVLLAERADEYGSELAREEGKTLREGIGEVRRAAQILDYVGHEPDRAAGEVFHSPRAGERILVVRRPVGTIGVITPFNFPIAIPAWKIAPALLHGNAVVWKASGAVPLLAVRLVETLLAAGLPADVIQLLHGDGAAGPALVAHPGIDAVTFTGSTGVGRAVASAGAARGIPVQAEMGGKNAAVVLADADLDLAVAQVIAGAFVSTGQKCTATSRLIVESAIADEFLARLRTATDALTVGNPLDPDVAIGPLVSAASRDAVLAGIDTALQDGATLVTSRAPRLDLDGGHFVAPTVLDCRAGGSEVWENELFGPVLAVRTAQDAASAFAMVNQSEFGLSAAVFTRDIATALTAVDLLDVGMLHINSETAGADPHVPFGGVKGSALGPAEQGTAAREFYTRPSTVYLRGAA